MFRKEKNGFAGEVGYSAGVVRCIIFSKIVQ
jgi:hypothetical protein